MRTEFDRYGETYEAAVDEAISFAGKEHGFYLEAKARRLLELTRRHLGGGRPSALDVGCGPGLFDRHLGSSLELHGVDVSPAMVERAQAANPEGSYRVYDGRRLPYADGELDVVFAVCVLHHVEPPDRPALLAEMARVTRPGGLVLVFEHNPLNPLTRLAVHRCELDEDAALFGRREAERLLRHAGLDALEYGYLLVTPWRGPISLWLERRLRRLPLGAQYFVLGRA